MKDFNLKGYINEFNSSEQWVENLTYYKDYKGREYTLCPLERFEEKNTEVGLAYFIKNNVVRATAYRKKHFYNKDEDVIKVYSNDSTCVSATTFPVYNREAKMNIREYDDFFHVEELKTKHYWNNMLEMDAVDSLKQNITYWYLDMRSDIKGHNFLAQSVVNKVYDLIYENEQSLREEIFASRIKKYLDEIIHRINFKNYLDKDRDKSRYEENEESLEQTLKTFNNFIKEKGIGQSYFNKGRIKHDLETEEKNTLIKLFNQKLKKADYTIVDNITSIAEYIGLDTKYLECEDEKLRTELEDILDEEDVGVLSRLFFLIGDNSNGIKYSRAKELFEEYTKNGKVEDLEEVSFAYSNFYNMLDNKCKNNKITLRKKIKKRALAIGISIPLVITSLIPLFRTPMTLPGLISDFIFYPTLSTLLSSVISAPYWIKKNRDFELEGINKEEEREKLERIKELKNKLKPYI